MNRDQPGETFIATGTRLVIETGSEEQPEVVRWMAWRPGVENGLVVAGFTQLLQSYALITSEGTVLIDPTEPISSAMPRFEALTGRAPRAVVCTSSWHERDAYWFREHYGVTVYAPKYGADDLEGRPDELYGDGDALPGGVQAVVSSDLKVGQMPS